MGDNERKFYQSLKLIANILQVFSFTMASEDEAKLLIRVTLIDPNRIIGLLVERYERHWERNDIYRNHNLIKATPQHLDVLLLLQFVIFNRNYEAKIIYANLWDHSPLRLLLRNSCLPSSPLLLLSRMEELLSCILILLLSFDFFSDALFPCFQCPSALLLSKK